MNRNLIISAIVLILAATGCNPEIEEGVRKKDLKHDVELTTDFGVIVFRLSDETPLHRNNFIRLVNQGFYDSLLFHRVINNFLVQTGDPDSRVSEADASLGETDLPYTVPAEFTPNLFHKRGAINAARNDNPERASSSTQFTIIQGRVYNDSTLAMAESRINGWLASNRVVNDPANKELFELQQRLRRSETGRDSLAFVRGIIDSLVQADQAAAEPYRIPEAHREVYKSEGGAAHLDQNYTVFGEVISGMEVVDKIAAVETNRADRPVNDVRIISARMIRRKN
ncbi:MAG: peptidylprolyl isomerase [Bacteroidales bacterium]|nr:peptidylprolyl isomerase [Bacteroidales bacterium]